MPTYEYQNTGTAADLIKYEQYTNPAHELKLTRSETTAQEWVIKETGGEIFYIQFGKNFSKKHFITASKKTTPQAKSVDSKIDKLLVDRSKSDLCHCAHKIDKHQYGKSKTSGGCKVCAATPCNHFATPYERARTSDKNR